jgi:hypothetical protein
MKNKAKAKIESLTSHLSPQFTTSDLYLAAFLRARGCFLSSTACREGRVFFIFDGDKIAELKQAYLNNGKVNVLDFKSALTELRNLIFNSGSGRG